MLYRFIRSLRANITFLKIQYDLEYDDISETHSLFEVICTDVWFARVYIENMENINFLAN